MFKKSTIFALFISILSFILFTYRIDQSMIYHTDFARDLYEILKIAQGNFTLLGPKLSFGGLYTAPYYFYLFVPAFLLSGFQIISIHIFNAFIFAFAIFYFSKRAIETYGLWKGIVASILLSIIPLYVFAARNPNNGSSNIALLLILLTTVQFEDINHWLKLMALGFLYGVIINFNFVAVALLPSLLILILYKLRNRKTVVLFIFGIVGSFFPLLLFEIKHNFIILKNTFIQKSYLAWIENKNISKGVVGKKNIFENILFLAREMKQFLSINPLIGYGVFTGIYFFEKRTARRTLLFFNGLLALLILSGLIRFQFAIHYLYPTAYFLFFTLIILLLETRFSIILAIMIAIAVTYFPTHLYKRATITFEPFEKAVQFVIKKHILEKNSRFNVVHIAHPNAIVGFEYRYFFQKYGHIPLSEFEYGVSDTLLVFTEKKNFSPSSLRTWEIEQFGRKYMDKTEKYVAGNIHIYKVQKK